jgi:hypothetical protein
MDNTAGTSLFVLSGTPDVREPLAAPERDLALRHPDLGSPTAATAR